jgi:drug/metabolite transporter (DMT)-like permease
MVNIIDSHLLSRRMPSLGAFLLPAGICHLIYSSVILALFPFPEGLTAFPLAVAIASAILRAVAITIMLYTMTREEVSQVIPVVYTYPIFVAIMAVMLLGESLDYLQWLAIVIVAAGAVMVSLRRSPSGNSVWLGKSFGLLFVSSLLMAGADVASKYALNYISFWNMYCLSVLAMSSLYFVVSVRGSVFHELQSMQRRGRAMALIAFTETLSFIGIVLSFRAIEGGPVSLVSTILSSRPIFVFIYALILSRVFPVFLKWQPTRATLLLRFTATAMIVGGVAAIYLL